MRSFRSLLVAGPLALAALAACSSDDSLTNTVRPPLAGVRYIHALPDTGRVDIKMVDQLEYSANTIDGAGGVTFRAGTRYFPTEAGKPRRIRVFSWQNSALPTVSSVLVDTSITFQTGINYTLVLTGSARDSTSANRRRFLVIADTVPTDAALRGRLINLTAAPMTGVVLTDTTLATGAALPNPIPSTGTTIANVPALGASAYVSRAIAASNGFLAFYTSANGTNVTARVVAGNGFAAGGGFSAQAGARVGGSAFTAVAFPAATASSGATLGQSGATLTALQNPAVQLFWDRVP